MWEHLTRASFHSRSEVSYGNPRPRLRLRLMRSRRFQQQSRLAAPAQPAVGLDLDVAAFEHRAEGFGGEVGLIDQQAEAGGWWRGRSRTGGRPWRSGIGFPGATGRRGRSVSARRGPGGRRPGGAGRGRGRRPGGRRRTSGRGRGTRPARPPGRAGSRRGSPRPRRWGRGGRAPRTRRRRGRSVAPAGRGSGHVRPGRLDAGQRDRLGGRRGPRRRERKTVPDPVFFAGGAEGRTGRGWGVGDHGVRGLGGNVVGRIVRLDGGVRSVRGGRGFQRTGFARDFEGRRAAGGARNGGLAEAEEEVVHDRPLRGGGDLGLVARRPAEHHQVLGGLGVRRRRRPPVRPARRGTGCTRRPASR